MNLHKLQKALRLAEQHSEANSPGSMTINQLVIVLLVAEAERNGDELSINDVAHRMHMNGSTATRNLQFLEKGRNGNGHGLVTRFKNPVDHRSKLVTLTKAGRQLVKSIGGRE